MSQSTEIKQTNADQLQSIILQIQQNEAALAEAVKARGGSVGISLSGEIPSLQDLLQSDLLNQRFKLFFISDPSLLKSRDYLMIYVINLVGLLLEAYELLREERDKNTGICKIIEEFFFKYSSMGKVPNTNQYFYFKGKHKYQIQYYLAYQLRELERLIASSDLRFIHPHLNEIFAIYQDLFSQASYSYRDLNSIIKLSELIKDYFAYPERNATQIQKLRAEILNSPEADQWLQMLDLFEQHVQTSRLQNVVKIRSKFNVDELQDFNQVILRIQCLAVKDVHPEIPARLKKMKTSLREELTADTDDLSNVNRAAQHINQALDAVEGIIQEFNGFDENTSAEYKNEFVNRAKEVFDSLDHLSLSQNAKAALKSFCWTLMIVAGAGLAFGAAVAFLGAAALAFPVTCPVVAATASLAVAVGIFKSRQYSREYRLINGQDPTISDARQLGNTMINSVPLKVS